MEAIIKVDAFLEFSEFGLFFNFMLDTCPFVGPLIPCFGLLVTVSSGFQSQSEFCLIRSFAEAYVNLAY